MSDDDDYNSSIDSLSENQQSDDEFANNNKYGTKEDQIYGIFNNTTTYNKSTSKQTRNLSNNINLIAQPMSFISSSNKPNTENNKPNNSKFNDLNPNIIDDISIKSNSDDEDESINESEGSIYESDESINDESLDNDGDDDDIHESSLKRVRFTGITKDNKPKSKSSNKPSKKIKLTDDEINASDAINRLHSMKSNREFRDNLNNRDITPEPEIKYIRPQPKAETKDKDFAKFASNEKGGSVAMKMMLKMGLDLKNPRLGKYGQGIVNPIMPTSADVLSEKPKAPKPKQPEPNIPLEAETFVPSWKKSKAPKKKYVTATEYIEKHSAPIINDIIDMRGPESKVISGKDITILHSETFPELRYNLNTIVSATELELAQVGRKWTQFKQTTDAMKRDRKSLIDSLSDKENKINRLECVLTIVESFSKMELTELTTTFATMYENFREEFYIHQLNNFGLKLLLPLFKKYISSWSPLTNDTPKNIFTTLKTWKPILGDLFHVLMEEIVNKLRTIVINSWDPRDSASIILMLDEFVNSNLFQSELLQKILSSLIYPKLKVCVESWSPADPIPITVWLPLWNIHLGELMHPLYTSIRNKVIIAMKDWHPSDLSAVVFLSSFKTFLNKQEFETIVMKAILPKLSTGMQNFKVNPQNQSLEAFNNLMSWEQLLPSTYILNLLDQEFWPKWFQALFSWLSSPSIDFTELMNWYLGWKSQFPRSLIKNHRITVNLARCLDLINALLDHTSIENVMHDIMTKLRKITLSNYNITHNVSKNLIPKDDDDISFKDVIARFAEQHDLVLMPSSRGLINGFQIYNFGKAHVYLDAKCIYLEDGHQWKPIALDELLLKEKNLSQLKKNNSSMNDLFKHAKQRVEKLST